jgi:hypothetical protein
MDKVRLPAGNLGAQGSQQQRSGRAPLSGGEFDDARARLP